MSARTFLLPDLGEGLTEAEIVRWLVAEGDIIEIDQPVVEVETAKAVVEVPSPHAGRVATRHAAEGTTLDVGSPLITVAEPGGSGNVLIGYGTTPDKAAVRHRKPRIPHPRTPEQHERSVPMVLSPLVRRLARDTGVDLTSVNGTGPGGVITRHDVEAASPPTTPKPGRVVVAGERRIPLNGFRKQVAAVLTRSRAEIPEATIWVDVDATALWELRERGRAVPGSPGLLAYVARFVVAGLREYPVFNARLDIERQEIVELDRINLGLAVQSDRGLVVPAIPGAETMTTSGLDSAIRDLTARARRGESTPAELSAGTFTLNNYGAFRVDGSAAIINHPQVAMLGIGRIIDRPWVVDGALTVRKVTQLSFVFDHRICDGGAAAGFLRTVADAMEDPPSALARL
ncbi:dihydrolipoamide acetyltransferase family protein [Actinoplanes derwentensis]|uniref:Dihydrolipoamide acetyltransferase component of pyruvate dehydrogenase complex n=1 Tax=Actinoplanes derwentensis TaxID=113562 RepID=A0A1H1VE72_9ACTN|nr:dihydrolipoamide acetyltransferase family protein [Actinoplanes derwentensis]GID83724.1 dihydrolipoamide acetyltransferase component of pyruvate dehydrogenase complex [Actinoplanes derwentensis]SDS83098.1 pyruvate dehydrogenase E2 component (dihydrolipoamide acetyltransferase) [Actinoplanes derwentensis]